MPNVLFTSLRIASGIFKGANILSDATKPAPARVNYPPSNEDRPQKPQGSNVLTSGQTNTRGAFFYKDDPSKSIQFQFNPSEWSDSKSATYEDRSKTGFNNTDYIWINGGARTIPLTLFLDATNESRGTFFRKSNSPEPTSFELFTHDPERGVLNQVEFLQALLIPTVQDIELPRFIRGNSKPAEQFASPPSIIWVFGNFYLEGVISSLETSYKLWSSSLIPLRAEVSLTIRVKEGRAININQNLVNSANNSSL